MTIIEALEIPEKHIPFGKYCYENTDDGKCPFWERKSDEYPEYEDGYCHYLHKSDWDLNEENANGNIIHDISCMNNPLTDQTIEETFGADEVDERTGKITHFPSSLIWDQVKECNVNMREPDETEIIHYNTETGELIHTTVGEIRKGKENGN